MADEPVIIARPEGIRIPQSMFENNPVFPNFPQYEITTDGTTVWVNSEVCSIGRFGVMGIDVHSADATSCLHCTHQRTTAEDWETFKQDMLKYHSVHVSDEFKPERFR